MYPDPMTNNPGRVAPDHHTHLPGRTPVRPRRPIAAGVLSVLLGLSCFAASPAHAYRAGGGNDRPSVGIPEYETVAAYLRDADRIHPRHVKIGDYTFVWNHLHAFRQGKTLTSVNQLIKSYNDVAAYRADSTRTTRLYANIGSEMYRVTDLEARNTAGTLSDLNLPGPVQFPSVAVGQDAYAGDYGATAIGVNAGASIIASTAIGRHSRASGWKSTALGTAARANGRSATAVGRASTAVGTDSTSLGAEAEAVGIDATSLGSKAEALNQGATALGSGSRATSYASTALGYSSWATGLHGAPSGSTAVGVKSHATGEKSAALGGYATAAGDYSTAVGQASEAHGHDTVAVGRGAVAGAVLSSSAKGETYRYETYRYSNVAKYLADNTRPSKVETVQIGKNVYQVAALNRITSLTKDNLPGALTTTTGGVAVGFRAAAEGMNSIALGWKAEATGTNGIAIGSGSGVSAGANEVIVGTSEHTYKLPGLKTTSGTRVVTVDSNGQLSTQSTTTGTASSRGGALRGAAGLSSEVTAVSRTEAADYEKAPAIGSGPTAPATAEQRRVVVQDTNRDGSVRLRTLDFGDLSGMEQRLAGVDRRVTSLSERLNKATAMSSALSALPNIVPGDNRFFLGVGAGHYSSEQALAIGMSARVQSRVFVNAGVALASGDEVSVRGGVGVVW